jgi:hypothetical protein
MSSFRWFLFLALTFGTVAAQEGGQPEKDPHRPPCDTANCRKIRSFVKAHYCGASPFANGPDDGCDTRVPRKLSIGIKAIADFNCQWDEVNGKPKCEQRGGPPPEIRSFLLREMRQLGLPKQSDAELHFIVWEPSSNAWTLAAAYYEHVSGSDLSLCQLIAVIDQYGRSQILRKVAFQKTDVDVPEVTRWSPIDITDVDGDGQMEIIWRGTNTKTIGMRYTGSKTVLSR